MLQMTRGSAAALVARPRSTTGRAAAWLLCGVGVLVGCGSHPGFHDPRGPRRAGNRVETTAPSQRVVGARGDTLRVVTFNIEYGDLIDQAAREMLRDEELSRADVVTVQEVSGSEAERLAKRLGMNFVYYPATLRNDDEFGNAILSRLPITRDWKLVLPHEPPFGGGIRIAVGAELGVGEQRFVVYSIHNETFVMSPEERLDQVRRVLGDAAGLQLPVIVAGDFNTMDRYSRVQTARVFGEAGYLDATRGAGATAYPLGGLLTAELDHVFVRGFEPLRAGTRATASSDHRPLFAELRLRSLVHGGAASEAPPSPDPPSQGMWKGR